MISLRFMIKTMVILTAILLLFALIMVTISIAQEDEGKAKFANVVSIEGKSGISLLIANIYNDQRLVFALGGTVLMAILGLSLGQIAEMIMKILGIKRPRKT